LGERRLRSVVEAEFQIIVKKLCAVCSIFTTRFDAFRPIMTTRSPRKLKAPYTKGGRWGFALYHNCPNFVLASSKADSVALSRGTAGVPMSPSTPEFFASPSPAPNSVTCNAVHAVPIKSQAVLSTLPKLRKERKSQWEKADVIFEKISDEFHSLGDFLKVLFHPKSCGVPDERMAKHRMMVSTFLSSHSTIRMGDIISLIYDHGQSQPSTYSKDFDACNTPFPPTFLHLDIKYACPSLSTWATQLVGEKVSRECHALTKNDPDFPEHLAQFKPSSHKKPGATPVT
jgi:hypothetical protein